MQSERRENSGKWEIVKLVGSFRKIALSHCLVVIVLVSLE